MPDVTRIIEQTASETIYNDDWLVKDSVNQGTTKIQPSVLKAWINDGMATVEELETVVGNIADTYNTSESYVVDDLCIHEYAFYKCIGATTGTWDSTKWQATTIAEIIATIDLSAEAISYDNTSSGLEAENVQGAIGETITKLSAVGSASGAIVTFDDGSDLPMPSLKVAIEPQQDLHGYDSPWVGGAGKNKWEFNSSLSGNGNVLSGKVFTNQIPLGTYTLSSKGTFASGGAMAFRFVYTDNTTKDITLGYNVQSGTYYVSEVFEKAVKGLSYVYSNNANNNINSIQLEQGETATSYEPYSNICPISGWDEANVTRTGKNLFDKSNTVEGIWQSNGTFEENNLFITVYCIVKPNTTYSIQGISGWDNWRLCYFNSLNPTTFTYRDIVKSDKFTTDADTVLISFSPALTTYGDGDGVQIEFGSTATTYESFNGHTYTIDLDGTRYGGTLDVVSGVLTVDRAYVDYPNMDTTSGTAVTGGWRCNFPCPSDDANKGKWSIQTGAEPILSMFDGSAPLASGGVSKGYGANEYTIIVANATSKAEADTALKGLQLVYKLSTPQTIQLTPTQVKSLLGVNNIWADTGNVLDAEYIRDTTTIINSLIARIEALENQ